MVKQIDSDALGEVTLALGLSGAGSPITELTDGVVDQTLSVGEIIRRSRTQAGTVGIYTPTMRTVHTDAEVLSVTVNPYNVGATAVVAPYPNPMPRQFEVWLLGASMRIASGSGGINATLSLTNGTRQQGWGVDDSGAQILVSQAIRLAFWNAIGTAGTAFGILAVNRGPHQKIGLRIPRPFSNLVFTASSALTTTLDCQLILGVFPIALGQDVLV